VIRAVFQALRLLIGITLLVVCKLAYIVHILAGKLAGVCIPQRRPQ